MNHAFITNVSFLVFRKKFYRIPKLSLSKLMINNKKKIYRVNKKIDSGKYNVKMRNFFPIQNVLSDE